MEVNLTYSSPRSGMKGLLDHITGPGATPAELMLQFLPAFGGVIAIYFPQPLVWNGFCPCFVSKS